MDFKEIISCLNNICNWGTNCSNVVFVNRAYCILTWETDLSNIVCQLSRYLGGRWVLCCLRTGHICTVHIWVLGVKRVKVVCQLDRYYLGDEWEQGCLTARCVSNWETGISFVCPLYTYVPKRQIRALLFEKSLCFLPGRQEVKCCLFT